MKVAILGNLAGVSQDLIAGLRDSGITADLFMSPQEYTVALADLEGQNKIYAQHFKILNPLPKQRVPFLSEVVRSAHRMSIAKNLAKYDLIHSHTGSLNWSMYTYLLFVKFKFKPYLAFATGSDFREMARYDFSWRGWMMRDFFKSADSIYLLNLDMLNFKDEMGFSKAQFFPFVINTSKLKPSQIATKSVGKKTFKLFMMSNLDFGINDWKDNRNSYKANHRVFLALARFIRIEKNVRLVAIYRGPDRKEAKQFVKKLGLKEYITFKPPMTEIERFNEIAQADVVIDQFYVGAFGLGALESMSMGKPLITYIDAECYKAVYHENEQPFLNAYKSNEIYNALLSLRDPNLRAELAYRARQFVLRHHSKQKVIPMLVDIYNTHIKK